MEPTAPTFPLGSDGRVQAAPLANGTGAHALLVRDAQGPRVLLTVDEALSADRRAGVVVTPLDDDVDVRVDGDALAVWLAQGSIGESVAERTPGWASAIGVAVLLALVALAVLGSLTFFGWLFRVLGLIG
jgi:threonine/homoserine/homoserine lactone efflux protein